MYDDTYRQMAMRRLRSVLEAAADEVDSVQVVLHEATGDFNRVSQEVIRVVGGSAQRVDQEMVASLDVAVGSTISALAALATVKSTLRIRG